MKRIKYIFLLTFMFLFCTLNVNADYYKKYNVGDVVSFSPDGTYPWDWVVIEDQGENSATVTLFSNSRVLGESEWNTQKDTTLPPYLILEKLNDYTGVSANSSYKKWTKVEDLTETYDGIDYTGYKARLITANEVAALSGLKTSDIVDSGDISTWGEVVSFLQRASLQSYWTSTPRLRKTVGSSQGGDIGRVFVVTETMQTTDINNPSFSSSNAIQPVIVVKKTNISASNLIKDPSKISLNKSSLTLEVDKNTSKLVATVEGSSNADKTVKWTSSKNEIATVDENGVITPIKAGETTITATTSNGLKASCTVKVNPQIINETITIQRGVKTEYKLTSKTGVTTGSFSSSNTTIVEPLQDSYFKGKKVGTAILKTKNDYYDITLTVNVVADKVYLQGDLVVLKAGETYTFDKINALGNINWTSSDKSIVSVDQNGKITALKEGNATITGSKENYEYENKIMVLKKEEQQQNNVIKGSKLNIAIGEKVDLQKRANLENATWISSLASIASVDANGVVTSLEVGTTIIIATTKNAIFINEVEVFNKIEDKVDEKQTVDILKNDKVLPEDAEVEANRVEKKDDKYKEIADKLEDIEKMEVIEVEIISDGKKIEPNGEIIIEFDIPEGYDPNKIVVIRQEKDGTFTNMPYEIVNNKIQVKTTATGTFIIAQAKDKNNIDSIINNGQTNKNETKNEGVDNPTTGVKISFTILIVGILLASGIRYYTKKRSKFIKL